MRRTGRRWASYPSPVQWLRDVACAAAEASCPALVVPTEPRDGSCFGTARHFVASAEPAYDDPSLSSDESDHRRRLAEMHVAVAARTSRHTRRPLDDIPPLQLPRRRQEQQQEQQEQEQERQPLLDWREVVEHARRTRQQRISGSQMLTDSFRRTHTYLRISLTERCNLRCQYCMPPDGVDLTPSRELLSADEVLRLARLFVSAGVDKIRLTGGEPTVRRDILDITSRLAALPGLRTLAMTSNGLMLPRLLPELQRAGLSAINISLDTLRPERFEQLTRRRGHERVLAAIDSALALGYAPVKVNVVVMRGVNDDEVADFVELTRRRAINVRFIEFMPFDDNAWGSGRSMVRYQELLAAVRAAYPQGLQRLADPAGEVAKNFRVPGFVGSVSFITSMTAAFCGDCNRLRLLADGSLKVCLFGPNEVSLRDALREGASDEELRLVVSAAVDRKRAAHAGMFDLAATRNRAMVTIGG